MSTKIKRTRFDFHAKNYKTLDPTVEILSKLPDSPTEQSETSYRLSLRKGEFIQRWYFSLQGEGDPIVSRGTGAPEAATEQLIYRYDWAFGITVLKGFYWNWRDELCDDTALAVHLLLKPIEEAPEAVPIAATLSTLRPSRNTKSIWELAWARIPKGAADMAKTGASVFPFLNYVSSGLMLGSNVLESYTENQKNWFIYQFLDEKQQCPVVEWRIGKKVLIEYGPLIRGTLFLAFYSSGKPGLGSVRMLLRPQIRYCGDSDICFIVPTDELSDDKQVFIDVKPKEGEKAAA